MTKQVAYFCMEFGLHEDFRIYSGGLGILAGDILKAAKDEGLPMVGVGIRWRQGYVRQRLDASGQPYDSFFEEQHPFLEDTGVEVSVTARGREIALKVWKCERFKNAPLYLLDAYLPQNADKLITGQLYGWFGEERLVQEIILGVGGVRALKALGIEPDIYHFNDSHPVVAGLELIRQKMKDGAKFEQAWQGVREKIVFTTHTPVVAGNESYDFGMLDYAGVSEGFSKKQLRQIGGEPFGMTPAGLRISKKANAVAQLHGETAKRMWREIDNAAPILAITNGVHNGTWQDPAVANADGAALWAAHQASKNMLLLEVSRRAGRVFMPGALTIGFARRAAPYKRSDLIFRKPELIEPLLKKGMLQLIFSGKAHPNDMDGKQIISNLAKKANEFPNAVVFLEDYDMAIGKLLTRGCDVWLNNPIRPLEASGTSGMKAAMNGVLNLSVLDGWWPEGCEHGVNGWQIGGGYEGDDCDEVDLNSLYDVLLNEVVPTYYNEREKWIGMMRASIGMASHRFSAARMVREYYEKMY